MLSLSGLQMKLIGGLVAALLVLGLVAERGRWMGRAHRAESQASADCREARIAAHSPRLDCSQTDEQIKFMGETITALSNSLARQNAAVAAMGAETKRQQEIAAKAENLAAERQNGISAVQHRLEASAHSAPVKTAPCEPSDTLKGAWQ